MYNFKKAYILNIYIHYKLYIKISIFESLDSSNIKWANTFHCCFVDAGHLDVCGVIAVGWRRLWKAVHVQELPVCHLTVCIKDLLALFNTPYSDHLQAILCMMARKSVCFACSSLILLNLPCTNMHANIGASLTGVYSRLALCLEMWFNMSAMGTIIGGLGALSSSSSSSSSSTGSWKLQEWNSETEKVVTGWFSSCLLSPVGHHKSHQSLVELQRVLLRVPQIRVGLHKWKYYVVIFSLKLFQISFDSLWNSCAFQKFIPLLLWPSKRNPNTNHLEWLKVFTAYMSYAISYQNMGWSSVLKSGQRDRYGFQRDRAHVYS